MVNNIIIFTKKRLPNEKKEKNETQISSKKWNILKTYMVNFGYFKNINLIKLCQIILSATNALKV